MVEFPISFAIQFDAEKFNFCPTCICEIFSHFFFCIQYNSPEFQIFCAFLFDHLLTVINFDSWDSIWNFHIGYNLDACLGLWSLKKASGHNSNPSLQYKNYILLRKWPNQLDMLQSQSCLRQAEIWSGIIGNFLMPRWFFINILGLYFNQRSCVWTTWATCDNIFVLCDYQLQLNIVAPNLSYGKLSPRQLSSEDQVGPKESSVSDRRLKCVFCPLDFVK